MKKEAEEKVEDFDQNLKKKEESLKPKMGRIQGWDYFFNAAFYPDNPKTRLQRRIVILYFTVLSLILLVFFQETSILITILVRILGAVGLVFTLYYLCKEIWLRKSR